MVVLPLLSAGKSLKRGQHLISPNQQFKVTHQFDGNVALYQKGRQTALWSTNTFGMDTKTFVMQEDGNLVLYTATEAVWESGTFHKGGKLVRIQEDGNFVMYNGDGNAVWSSGSYVGVIDDNQLAIGEMTIPGHSLVSENKHNKLVFTSDGNLVVEKSGKEVWSSHSGRKGGKYLIFQNDGKFVIYGDSSRAIWSTCTVDSGAVRAIMQDDGNFVLYNKDDNPVWATGTY